MTLLIMPETSPLLYIIAGPARISAMNAARSLRRGQRGRGIHAQLLLQPRQIVVDRVVGA